jgi:isopenicillin-N epimerase
MMDSQSLKAEFLLDPDVIFLNHGSFGACPRPVFEEYQRWQRELERQPVEFLGRRAPALLAEARAALAAYVGAAPDEVVYFPNPTTALNVVARSLKLQPGDEILTTDHEYGALDRTWRFISRQTGARYVRQTIPLPLGSPDEIAEALWAGVTARTRLVFVSHLTSPTALIFPVAEICRRARQAGLLSVVDGAHAPGQLPLNLTELGADFYSGACHKWLCAPKGSAFLYARREVQRLLEPLVVSWGWESESPSDSRFVDHQEWQGTRDLAAFLATAAAIRYQAERDWPQVRERCHTLLCHALAQLSEITQQAPFCAPGQLGQMAALALPPVEVLWLKERLCSDYRIEVPVYCWNDLRLLRLSVQGYNSEDDIEALARALHKLLPG